MVPSRRGSRAVPIQGGDVSGAYNFYLELVSYTGHDQWILYTNNVRIGW